MSECPHRTLVGREVQCSLGFFGGRPHIGVCRSCWEYYGRTGQYLKPGSPAVALPPCEFREMRDLLRPCGLSKRMWCVKGKPALPATLAMCLLCCGEDV
jgi:hypothetical protein